MSAVVAVILAVAALPSLAARAAGGGPPDPFPRLAALAPVAALLAAAGVIVAATVNWLFALLLAFPAALLAAWQLPPRRLARYRVPERPWKPPACAGQAPVPGRDVLTLRLLTLNVQTGSADAVAIVRLLHLHRVDVFFVQELTTGMARRLMGAGIAGLLPYDHLDPRPGASGTGLWARWPLTPLPPVPGVTAATPRARLEPQEGPPVTLTAVHPIAPMGGRERQWCRELAQIRSALSGTGGRQVVAGDFNASRDHRPFRDLLAAGFGDCADTARKRPWPGFTWPAGRWVPSVMRLDHVLVSGPATTVPESRVVRVPGTDHRGVLAVVATPWPSVL